MYMYVGGENWVQDLDKPKQDYLFTCTCIYMYMYMYAKKDTTLCWRSGLMDVLVPSMYMYMYKAMLVWNCQIMKMGCVTILCS